MSHLQDTDLLTQLPKDPTSPSNLQEPFLMDQLPQEMQCQFVQKPHHLAVPQQLSVITDTQKTLKRRRAIINWAFWHGASTHLDNWPKSPTCPMPGPLFGMSVKYPWERQSSQACLGYGRLSLIKKEPSQKASSDSQPMWNLADSWKRNWILELKYT